MPISKKLDLRINELVAKRRWLASLSGMLRDARVLGDGRWDVRRMCYEVDLERIAYEARIAVGCAFEYPSIRCRLGITPVLGCVDGRDGLEERWEGEIVEGLELRDSLELEVVTSYGVTRLRLGERASLEIRDFGTPIESHTVSDYGDPAVDLHRAGELVRLRVV